AEDIRLSLKLSIGAGEVTTACLGGVFDRWELLVAGDPLAQVAPANALAHPGDVVLSPAAWQLAEGACDGEPLADGFRRLGGARAPPPGSPRPAGARGGGGAARLHPGRDPRPSRRRPDRLAERAPAGHRPVREPAGSRRRDAARSGPAGHARAPDRALSLRGQ